jgi:RNA polymerase sigma-70 factor (ECF subfamily)
MEKNKQNLSIAYEEHADALFRYCLFKISDREKALDLVQETFTRAWQYLVDGKEIENIKPFLYTTARHLVIDEYRKKKIVSLDDMIDQGAEPRVELEAKLFTSLDVARVMECVHKLPESYSSIIVMRYVNDLSVKDIAKVVNESENVVSVRIHRGLSKLRTLISP